MYKNHYLCRNKVYMYVGAQLGSGGISRKVGTISLGGWGSSWETGRTRDFSCIIIWKKPYLVTPLWVIKGSMIGVRSGKCSQIISDPSCTTRCVTSDVFLTSVCLSFLLCKMRMQTEPNTGLWARSGQVHVKAPSPCHTARTRQTSATLRVTLCWTPPLLSQAGLHFRLLSSLGACPCHPPRVAVLT